MPDKKPDTIQNPNISVQTIPADFYGGVNPVVKFKKVEKEIEAAPAAKLTPVEKKLHDRETSAGGAGGMHPANLLTSGKGLLLLGGLLFVLFAAGGGIYYWLQARNSAQPNVAVSIPQTQTNVTPPAITPTTTAQPAAEIPSTTPPTTTQPQSLAQAPLEFPSALLGDSADLDKDGLTDAAEEIFGTDPSKPDTDGDSYADGHEVYYLYDPAKPEPARLIDSGDVVDYKNPSFGYSLYYPKSWAFGDVDGTGRDILVSTLTGENIEIRVFDKDASQSFPDWFGVWAPTQQYGDLADFETYFKQKGLARNDNLVYYFYTDTNVYVILYHTTDSNVVNYRSVINMMARSFRLPNYSGPQIIPESAETAQPPGGSAGETEAPVPTTTVPATATAPAAGASSSASSSVPNL